MNSERKLAYFLLLAFLISFSILAFQSQGIPGGADDLNHFRFSRYAFSVPGYLWDTWAKAVFTFLMFPAAQFGYIGVKLLNVLFGLSTALLVYLSARQLGYRNSLLSMFLLLFAPMYTLMMLSGMTEVMFSFFLALGIYLFFRKMDIWSAIAISLLPFIRTEGFVIFPFFMLAYLLNRQWRAIPFLFAGFVLLSFLGSFHHGEFFWLITKNPYGGGAVDIYGKGELLYYVNYSSKIFGLPFSLLTGLGLLMIPLYLLGRRRNRIRKFTIEFLVAYMPFLVYFCAHSYVFWQGKGNSVGEIRVMAAVFPSAVLLALFGWERLMEFIRIPHVLKVILGIALAILLVFIPFRIYSIPTEPSRQQVLIRQASEWISDMELDSRKIHYYDPYWWFYLDINPTDPERIREGLPDPSDPSRNVPDGSLVLWDAHYSPNEGRTPLQRLQKHPDFIAIKSFFPPKPFEVLGDNNYELHIFEKLENRDMVRRQALLEELQAKEDAMFLLSLLYFEGYEPGITSPDSASLVKESPYSGISSMYVGGEREFVGGLETTVAETGREENSRLNIRFAHRFLSLNREEPLLMVLSLQDGEDMIYYQTWEIRPDSINTWTETVIDHEFPAGNSPSDFLKIYLWNMGKHEFLLDDFTVSRKDPV